MASKVLAYSLFLIVVSSFAPALGLASQCGGTLTGDTGTIIYPAESKNIVQADELCIWTIQLESKTNVRLNFSHLDFEGGDGACSQGSVRAYSLTNGVAQGNMESYTICPGADSFKESRGIYYLSENTIIIIFRTAPSGEQGGSGFVLNWEGIKFISDPVQHVSTVSNETTGIIRHPILGEYQPNTISTWLVSNRNVVDGYNVLVESANIETCPMKDKRMRLDDTVNCFCDALILYQIELNGELKEVKRICGDLENVWNSTTVGSGFLVVLFADSVDTEGSGTGFQMIWTPVQMSEKLSTTCNQVLNLDNPSLRGRIEFVGDAEAAKVCLWTVRANGAKNLIVNIHSFEPPLNCNNSDSELVLHYSPFNNWYSRELTSVILQSCDSSQMDSLTIPGPVAFFSTSSQNNFEITITQSNERDESYPTSGTDEIYTQFDGSIIHENYTNYEYSSFLIAPKESSGINDLSYFKLSFSSISLDTYCDDAINVLVLERNQFVLKKSLCQEDLITEYIGDTVILLLFKSNYELTEDGFVANWKTKIPTPSTECGGIIDLSRDLGEIHFTEEKEPEVSGEQCVWTIRAAQSEEIQFKIEDIEFDNCQYTWGLYVAGFSNYTGAHDDTLPIVNENIGNCENPSASPVISISGPLAFLVFPRVSVGSFKLKIANIITDQSILEYPYNSNYTDFQFSMPNGSLMYPGPENWPQFDAHLWMSFVINPVGVVGRTVLKFTYLGLGQANACWSGNIMTYELRNGLLEQYMICSPGQVGTVEIFGDHTIVLLLRTRSVWASYANTIKAEWERA